MQLSKGVFSVPNLLCFFRVAYIPVMVALFYLDHAFAADHVTWPAWTNLFIFALAAISDFFDGLIARAFKLTSLFGKFLDSSTDKLLVGAAVLCLVAFGKISGIWIIAALIILLREILISGVREFMALYNVVVPISKMGKWKLTLQMFSLGFFIVGDYGDTVLPYCVTYGKFFLIIATALTIMSGWQYVREAWATVRRLEAEGKV